jgi:hypothetical protein
VHHSALHGAMLLEDQMGDMPKHQEQVPVPQIFVEAASQTSLVGVAGVSSLAPRQGAWMLPSDGVPPASLFMYPSPQRGSKSDCC